MENRRDSSPSTDILAQLRSLLGLTGDQPPGGPLGLSLEALQRHTRRQLLACAEYLGLTGIQRLTKAALASRFQQALDALVAAAGAGRAAPAREEPADLPRKFELGRAPGTESVPEHIPWSYGQDRVTAMVVDPDRLYVYWEVSDEAIARARAALGPGGPDAWLSLRVYDVTHRIFDGTNAHGYFDHRVERSDRQWFLDIGKPTSTAIVEVGMKSLEGYFVKMARSGRADFPRREPAPPGDVEWLTVRTASGALEHPVRDSAPARPLPGPPLADGSAPVRVWDIRLMHTDGEDRWEVGEERLGDWEEILLGQWHGEQRTFAWEGPVVRTSWDAGPFTFPVEPPAHVVERHAGTVRVFSVGGRTHVVYGPWQVVIHGLAARAERRVLAVWEVHRWWTASTGLETLLATRPSGPAGSLHRGASERRWIAASELRLGGASELWRLGASELRFLGASETLYAAGSELRLRGASEQWTLGASEARYRSSAGASEQRWPPSREE